MKLKIVKENNSSESYIELDELFSKMKLTFELEDFKKEILELVISKTSSKEDNENLSKKDIFDLFKYKEVFKLNSLNLESISQIEKNKSIPDGTLYYDKSTGMFRGKSKGKWVNLNY